MEIQNVSTAPPVTVETASDEMGKDEFLKLLLVKLQNQDPLNPTSDEAFIADLAQFSSLEQMQNINDGISQLGVLQNNATNTSMVGYIGKTAFLAGNQVELKGGDANISYELAGSAQSVEVAIYNEQGQLVKRITQGNLPAGEHQTLWDGTNGGGTELPEGLYKMKITAKDKDGVSVAAIGRTSGTITGVSYENGVSELIIFGQPVSLSQVISIGE